MPRIAALALENVAESIRPTLQGIQKGLGFIPNTFATIAHSPAALNSYLQFSQAMSKTSLTEQEREAIALAASEVNGCEYCIAAHSVFALKAGLTLKAVKNARGGGLNQIASFARLVTETRGHLKDSQLANARNSGLNDTQIIEIIAQIALLTFSNYLNNVAATANDWPEIQ